MRVERLQKDYEIEVEWKGMEIHPGKPALGVKRDPFGRPYTSAVVGSLQRLAADAGVSIKAPDVLANSHLALLAAEFARDAGLFEPFHHRLFVAYFQDGQNISEPAVVQAAAQESGLDLEGLREALADGRYEGRLAEAHVDASRLGIDGVPTFLMGEMSLVGAQPYEFLRRMAEQAGASKKGN